MDFEKFGPAQKALYLSREAVDEQTQEFYRLIASLKLSDDEKENIQVAFLQAVTTGKRVATAELYHQYVQEPSLFVKMAEEILDPVP